MSSVPFALLGLCMSPFLKKLLFVLLALVVLLGGALAVVAFTFDRSSAGGGIGAPPSNTAPSKDIAESQVTVEVLHQGIDSLYLSYPGTLSEQKELVLSALKANAKHVDSLTACQCIYTSGDLSLSVRDRGVGRFPFILFNDRYNIRISSSRAAQLPLASIQVKSWYLMKRGVPEILEELSGLLLPLGNVEDDAHLSRADLCVDFISPHDLFALPREAWVGRAKNAHQYWTGDQCTGWVIGQGGPIDRTHGFLHCRIDEAAGVHDDNVGLLIAGYNLIALDP